MRLFECMKPQMGKWPALFWIAFMSGLTIIVCLGHSAQAFAASTACGFDPDRLNEHLSLSGMQNHNSSSSQTYQGRELYDYMNGGAVEYLDAGFECLWVKEFEGADNERLVLEIFTFSASDGAERMYLEQAGDRPLDLGQEGSWSAPDYVVFRQGKALGRVLAFHQEKQELTLELGKAAAQALSVRGGAGSGPEHSKRDNTVMKGESTGSVVIIGASYAKGWDIDSLQGKKVINKGVGGEESGEMLDRFAEDVVALNPDMVIIWGFINDIFRSEKAKMESTLEQAKDNLKAMVDIAKKNSIQPVLATEVTIRGKDGLKEKAAAIVGKLLGKQSYQEYVNTQVGKVNRWIEDFAQREGLVVLDLEPVFSNQKGFRMKEYATSDGSHISQKGYERLTEYAKGVFEKSDAEKSARD